MKKKDAVKLKLFFDESVAPLNIVIILIGDKNDE